MEGEDNSQQDDNIIIVSCGPLTGKLHRDRFFCPGIHMECIETDGDFVSPKIFSVMGDKERLKDWKNAVRINGVSIRKMMENGQLDFHNHKENCCGRCMGKPNTKVKLEKLSDSPSNMLSSINESYSIATTSLTAASLGLHGVQSKSILNNKILLPKSYSGGTPRTVMVGRAGTKISNSLVPVTTTMLTGALASQAVFPQAIPVFSNGLQTSLLTVGDNGQNSDNMDSDTVNMDDGAQGDMINSFNGDEDVKPSAEDLLRIRAELEENEMTAEEAVQFWKGILEVGLLDEFFREAKAALDVLKSELIKKKVRIQDAVRISKIVHELGITSKLKVRLSLHKQETLQQNERLGWEIEELKRKMAETEQRQLHLKRKSDAFDHLLEMSNQKRVTMQEEDNEQD